MTDVAIAPSKDIPNGNTGAESVEKTDKLEKPQKSRPEKPDEDKYKEELAKAEKEHAAAQEKLVRLLAVRCI